MTPLSVPKIILFALVLCVIPLSVWGASPVLTLRYRHTLVPLNTAKYPDWRTTEEVWLSNGLPIRPQPGFRVDGDTIPPLPAGITRSLRPAWDRALIRATLLEEVSPLFDREAGNVVISQSSTGAVTFEGIGLPGRQVDVDRAALLVMRALEESITEVELPVVEVQPSMTVDPALASRGIREVVTVGESDFSGSPGARKHNIRTGLRRFSGHIIPQGESFSFNTVLGPVNAATGYLKELVILGDETLPDYGGGLCQVSTTAYRGVWEYGFPILSRRNHSFAVRYYAPQGTDATVYPPHTDMRFQNDSPASILIQSFADGDKAYFIYYGTRDARSTDVLGPYTWGRTEPPPDRTEYTTEIPPGTTRKAGERVPGMRAAWYRIVREDGKETIERVDSFYEARPFYLQIGIDPGMTLPGKSEVPAL
ncbi:MAG: VanW family protein [Candidatus Peregrinibacteria bacterium]